MMDCDEVNIEGASMLHHPQYESRGRIATNEISSVQQFREQFSWKASKLSQEEEMIKNQYENFQRKVAIARQHTDRQLLSISRQVERSRSKPIPGKSDQCNEHCCIL